MRIYLAGPRSGIKAWNTPAFTEAAARLRAQGHDVVNPAEVEDEMGTPAKGWQLDERVYWRSLIPCLVLMVDADPDAIVVLPGWRRSTGARLETFVNWLRGRPVLYYPTLRRIPRAILFAAWTGAAVRSVPWKVKGTR